MNQSVNAYVGIDWAGAGHQACVLDPGGGELGNASFPHSGAGLSDMCDWILELAGAEPEHVLVGIETPQGPVVEALQARGFDVRSINPRQLDRFRDRLYPAGSKDDRRDAFLLAGGLMTDPGAYRELQVPHPHVLELREFSRTAEELTGERKRLTGRIRDRLWRYYPQMLELSENLHENFFLDLWQAAPTPEQGRRLTRPRIQKILQANRIRRIDADRVKEILAKPSLTLADGTAGAAANSLALQVERLRLVNRQLKTVNARIDELLEGLDEAIADWAGQRVAEILRSIPGVGRTVLATLLAEAIDPLLRWDYRAARNLSGVAPVTRRSGKTIIVVRRRASSKRLVNAVHYWAGVAIQHDEVSRAKYDALRLRGHRHVRALRAVADRLLYVACTMLKEQTLYDPERRGRGWKVA